MLRYQNQISITLLPYSRNFSVTRDILLWRVSISYFIVHILLHHNILLTVIVALTVFATITNIRSYTVLICSSVFEFFQTTLKLLCINQLLYILKIVVFFDSYVLITNTARSSLYNGNRGLTSTQITV